MSNGSYIDELMSLADRPDELSARASQRLTLTILRENYRQTVSVKDLLEQTRNRVEIIEENLLDYPSLLWLIRHKTKPTIAAIAVLLAGVLAFGPFLLRWGINVLLAYLGIPTLDF